jgi:snurportin-1
LEEQKHRRAKRVESERHIDLFADLNLGNSDDEVGNGDEPDIVRDGVAQLAPLLTPQEPSVVTQALSPEAHTESNATTTFKRRGKRKKATTKVSSKNTSAWADKCMYAELLEMQETDSWPGGQDGLPSDLESGWVALAPVPLGKRCLAISHQGGGMIGVAPNTTLRSRVLGKPLMARFPSPLPSDTVLDCILDQNWRENGILHVLDVIKWKGQDIADCESSFRFWWRDTRLSELPPSPPPTTSAPPILPQPLAETPDTPGGFRFPYPTTFRLVPYFTDTTFAHLIGMIIPRARSSNSAEVLIPSGPADADVMDIESHQSTGHATRTVQAEIQPDGLLLYVAQSIYEPGTSPLSSWVPIVSPVADAAGTETSSPLDMFERLVKRRVAQGSRLTEADMLY